MAVPFIDLKRQLAPIRQAVLEDWATCFDETQFVGGTFVDTFEREMAEAIGVKHVVSCANGTDALSIALQALGVEPGTRVALPNVTFWATYEAVVNVGLVPVLVDIDADDLQMSFTAFVEAHEQYRFEAAILVHLFGWCSSRLDDFRAFCRDRAIVLLEDGAQSYGVTFEGASLFSGALATTLSFYPAKVIGGAMDGGGIATDDDTVASVARVLGNHGRESHYSYSHVGWNSRMGGLQAAFLRRMLGRSDELIESRRHAVGRYRAGIAASLGDRVVVHGPPAGVRENGYLLVLTSEVAAGRDLSARLLERGIGSASTYPETLDAQPPAARALRYGDLAVGREFCRKTFNLPLFAGITDHEVDESIQALVEVIDALQ